MSLNPVTSFDYNSHPTPFMHSDLLSLIDRLNSGCAITHIRELLNHSRVDLITLFRALGPSVKVLDPFGTHCCSFELDERLKFTETELITIIKACPNLKTINICLLHGGQRVLEAASTLQQLTSLTISFNEEDTITLPAGFSALEKLNIDTCNATSLDVSQCQTLKVVNISICNKIQQINGLEHLQQLEQLRLFACPLFEEFQLPDSSRLKEIHLHSCYSFRRIINLKNQIGLKKLSFDSRMISRIESLSLCTQLQALETNLCALSLADRVIIRSQLPPQCNWTINNFNPAVSHTMVATSHNPTADHINTYQVDLRRLPQVKPKTEKDLLRLLRFLGNDLKFLKLEGLYMNEQWGVNLTDSDIDTIVRTCPALEHFELTRADQLTDDVFRILGKLQHLRVLKLRSVSIQSFSPHGGYGQLNTLDLSFSYNLVEVASIEGMKALKQLIILYTPAARDHQYPKTGPEGYRCIE